MKISCYLIGEDSLLIQCGSILLERGHTIFGVISPLDSVKTWAISHNLTYFSCFHQFACSNNLIEVDYIFSIVNNYILSEKIINLARKEVINYHDSLLPKYAGLNSTTWAIINDEQYHGVTWHKVTNKIDAGDVLKQDKVQIFENDTVFTLNLRCYEQAIISFTALLKDIEEENLSLIKQNFQDRSYYGIGHCLPNFGFIDWRIHSINFICRISRALSFNHYNNNIGTLKIYFRTNYALPSEVTHIPKKSEFSSLGKILNITDHFIDIEGLDGIARISAFLSSQGQRESVKSIVMRHHLKIGLSLSNLSSESAKKINNLYSKILKNERYWVDLLQQNAEHSLFSQDLHFNEKEHFQKLSDLISLRSLVSFSPDRRLKYILSSILTYLYRLNNYDRFSITIVHRHHKKISTSYSNLFSIFLPFLSDWSPRISLNGILRHVSKTLKIMKAKDTFFTDIFVRHPQLQMSTHSGVYINLSGIEISPIPENAILVFNFCKETNAISISHKFDVNQKHSQFKDIINNMSHHIANILDKLLTNPHINVSSFCFLTDFEKKILLNKLGRGEEKGYSETNIISLFQKRVDAEPNNIAVIEDNKQVTYKELWDMSIKVSDFIQLEKVKTKKFIGIYTERSIQMLAIMMGILRANCIYVPLDTRYPLMKIETIARISDLSWIISSDTFVSKLKDHFLERQKMTIWSIKKIFNSTSISKPKYFKKKSENLAYIMFTSGTTGEPKGVMVTHRNIINYCLWFTETTHFRQKSSIDFSSSIAFDLSVPCTIAPLLVGGRIVVCNEATKANPKAYLNYLIKYQISHVELTPGYLEMLLAYPKLIKKLESLEVVLLGADVLPVRDALRWSRICPNHKIVNEYGPTETTVSATSYFIDETLKDFDYAVPIGRPGYNTSCYILDAYENLCPIGMKGELHIGGSQVTNGYLGKPILTKNKFIVFTQNNEQEIIYKTGDLVSWLPCGNLQFYGRNDFQVKIQGYRIELTGIEAVLLKIPQIQQAVVLPKSGDYKDKYLCAYLVMTAPHVSASEIKSFLLSFLPNYMIPKEIYITDHIPLKQNEKIDFLALQKQTSILLSYKYTIHENMNEYEAFISKTWQEAFHNNQIALSDDFFEVGGNSFIALHIVSEIKRYYRIDIPLSLLFEYPTIKCLAKRISRLCFPRNTVTKEVSSIVKLSENSNGIALFLIHPVGGSVFWYKQLASCLEKKYVIYGIQDLSIEGYNQRFDSLESMAQRYLEEIESFLPSDGYYIGGASFGATVAYEIANQLLKKNKKVHFLGIFDGWAKYPNKLMQTNTRDLLQHSENALKQIEQKKLVYLNELEKYRQKLLLKYLIPSLDINVFLFKARELWDVFLPINDPYNGWKPFIKGKIKTFMISGNHESMFFGENVVCLANFLEELVIKR